MQKVHNPFESIEDKLDRLLAAIESLTAAHTQKPEKVETKEELLTTDEVIKLLKVSSVTVWDWEKKGILTSYRIGNLKRFKLSEVIDSMVPIKRKRL